MPYAGHNVLYWYSDARPCNFISLTVCLSLSFSICLSLSTFVSLYLNACITGQLALDLSIYTPWRGRLWITAWTANLRRTCGL